MDINEVICKENCSEITIRNGSFSEHCNLSTDKNEIHKKARVFFQINNLQGFLKKQNTRKKNSMTC